MKPQILISPSARLDIINIAEFLRTKWSNQVAKKFINSLNYQLNIIKDYPNIFPESTIKKGLRKSVSNKRCCIYYRVRMERIEIVSILNTRINNT